MSRFTLRLPDTLHERLETLAEKEGVSLNQYILYALTQQSTFAYTITEVPTKQITEQRARYEARLQNAQTATDEEIDQFLAEREAGVPEPELTPEVVYKVRNRIAAKRGKSSN